MKQKTSVVKDKDSLRCHAIHLNSDGAFVFTDTGELTSETWKARPCGHCGEFGGGADGAPDPCLGTLPGVVNACCGHGESDASYVVLSDGVVLRGFTCTKEKT